MLHLFRSSPELNVCVVTRTSNLNVVPWYSAWHGAQKQQLWGHPYNNLGVKSLWSKYYYYYYLFSKLVYFLESNKELKLWRRHISLRAEFHHAWNRFRACLGLGLCLGQTTCHTMPFRFWLECQLFSSPRSGTTHSRGEQQLQPATSYHNYLFRISNIVLRELERTLWDDGAAAVLDHY